MTVVRTLVPPLVCVFIMALPFRLSIKKKDIYSFKSIKYVEYFLRPILDDMFDNIQY